MTSNNVKLFYPTWLNLESLFKDTSKLFICSPWISKEGVLFLRKFCQRSRNSTFSELEIWTRLDPYDYITGISDYHSLLSFIEKFHNEIDIHIKVATNLHMKVYMSDNSKIIITSANLTNGGFRENVEIGVLISDNKLKRSIMEYLKKIEKKMSSQTLDDIKHFIDSLNTVELSKKDFMKWEKKFEESSKKVLGLTQNIIKRVLEPPYIGLR